MRILVVAAGLLCLMWAEPALACVCRVPPQVSSDDYRRWFNGFEGAVFYGTAYRSEQVKGVGTKVSFRVHRHWKAVTSREVSVYRVPLAECSYLYERGRTYLVAATSSSGRLWSDLCAHTFVNDNRRLFLEAVGRGSPLPMPAGP